MNIADRGLQGKLPNNALLMFGASLGVVFSAIQMFFIHMDILTFIGLGTMFISLELYFSAYNYLRKEILWLIPLFVVAMLVNIFMGLYLIFMQERHCTLAKNKAQCFALSTIYGVVIIVCGAVIYGISALLAYYFYRLFPSEETCAINKKNSHLFDKADLMNYVESFDRMKKPVDLNLGGQLIQSPPSVQ